MIITHAQPVAVIPFNDLGRGTVALRSQIDEAIAAVLTSGWYVMGPEHNALERELSDYLGVANTILVGNGTDALQLALSGVGVKAGDYVLTAANAGGYTSTAVRSIGATPCFADIDADSHLLTVATLQASLALIPQKPRAVVVTHLFGGAADMVSIMDWARTHDMLVIEDCAQSLGAMVGEVRAGGYGDAATTSFYPTKNLGALGDGGAVFTSNEDVAARVRQLRQYGWESKYRTTIDGGRNSRLDELQAAILRVKLPLLDSWSDRRRAIHARYEAAATANVRFVNHAGPAFVGHLAVFEVADREAVRLQLKAAGIATDVHYPIPDHLQPLLADQNVVSLPITEFLAGHILSLPLFPELTEPEIERIVDAIGRI